ncbi:hypothetical protein J4232_04105 [Candidatus Woesearchaeota archaeon]|nr:hypothetical protein [Candidatus Woesearchaeota archaeon]
MPFISVPDNYQFSSMLERALFDPGYKITERFLKEAALYLKERGRLIIGWGDSENNDFGNQDKLKYLAEQYHFSIKLLVQEQSTEQNPVIFQLYELKRILEECRIFRRE